MRFCPFCGTTDVPRGRRYCCDEHRKYVQRQVARDRGKLRYALAKAIRDGNAKRGNLFRWRQIAMGLDADEHLAVVFRPKRKPRAFGL